MDSNQTHSVFKGCNFLVLPFPQSPIQDFLRVLQCWYGIFARYDSTIASITQISVKTGNSKYVKLIYFSIQLNCYASYARSQKNSNEDILMQFIEIMYLSVTQAINAKVIIYSKIWRIIVFNFFKLKAEHIMQLKR